MRLWGFGLYQNDTSLDVKDEFEQLYNNGKDTSKITEKLTTEYQNIMGNSDEEPLFWLALADTQWNLGVLMPSVREKALDWIWKINHVQGLELLKKAEWRDNLDQLKTKLLSPQSPAERPVKKRRYECQWKLGDTFAYRLESDLAIERGLYGQYFLIRKIDEGTCYPGHIVPIVYVKITADASLPSNMEEYNQLEYVQTWFTKYEERFWPIDMRHPQEDIAQKSKLDYHVDEYGFLPQYRVKLLNTSPKAIPSKLIYVGNFANAVLPEREFIPHSKENIVDVAWKQFNETFETKMIKSYCGHNLRELSIYAGT